MENDCDRRRRGIFGSTRHQEAQAVVGYSIVLPIRGDINADGDERTEQLHGRLGFDGFAFRRELNRCAHQRIVRADVKDLLSIIPPTRLRASVDRDSLFTAGTGKRLPIDLEGSRLGATWPELMQRIFKIDALQCPRCQGRLRILAAILPPDATPKILEWLGLPSRAPPLAPAAGPGRKRFATAPTGDADPASPARCEAAGQRSQ